jgi:peptidyl-prolyl cis-trans isomerase SurA
MMLGCVRSATTMVAVAIAGALMGGCQSSKAPAEAPAKAVGADVWATVDGREIHRDEVEKAYRSTVDPSASPAPSADEVLTVKLNVLDELITQDVLVARAKAAGLEASDADVDKALADRKGSGTDEAFQLQLAQRGFTLDDFKRGIKRELTTQKILERDVTSKINVSDKDVEGFFNENRAQFNLKETQYRLAQIVVAAGRDPQVRNRLNDDASTPEEVTRKANMLLERLKGGTDFGQLAMDFSEDPQSVTQGGDLGFVPASALARVAPALRDAVLKMQPGNISSVPIGPNITILALVSKEPAGQRQLSDPAVKANIKDALTNRKQELLRSAYLASARADAKVVNYLARQVVDAQGSVPPSLAPTAPGAAKP